MPLNCELSIFYVEICCFCHLNFEILLSVMLERTYFQTGFEVIYSLPVLLIQLEHFKRQQENKARNIAVRRLFQVNNNIAMTRFNRKVIVIVNGASTDLNHFTYDLLCSWKTLIIPVLLMEKKFVCQIALKLHVLVVALLYIFTKSNGVNTPNPDLCRCSCPNFTIVA